MQQQQWQKIKELFSAALEQPAADRSRFLTESCGNDAELRGEVESLLAAHEEPKNLLEQHTINLAAQLQAHDHYEGRSFGAYRIQQELGRGGMGAVFLAERADGEFQQQVALKIIRQSFADAELEKHFRRERQILASLNHANIAMLIDGGVSESGELFLVMEFIAGEPLIGFAETRRLTIEERLKLFLKICRAVSFAHQNLVIHRDLKPSNILVTKDGEPKLLDFGLAKIIDEHLPDASQTATAFRAFTPSYASPEQVSGRNITTASDVYSLGVVLYELLTLERPFKTEQKSYEEILKQINEHEPTRPSVAIVNQRTRTGDKQQSLKGDLDNIILMAMRKEPDRRYSSVEQLAQDIEKHLKGLPIIARANTLSYRAEKFLQRHRVGAIAAALVVLSLFTGLAIAFRQYRQAQRETAKAEEVNAFLQQLLLTANPDGSSANAKGYSTTINDVLDHASKRLESEDLSRQPEVKAQLQQIMGICYLNQGQYDRAEKYLREALATQSQLYSPSDRRVLTTNLSLAQLSQVKARYDEAEQLYAQNLPLAREQYRKQNLPAMTLLIALNNYALLLRARGDSKQAELLFRENLLISSQRPGVSADRTMTETMLTLTLLDQGKFEDAEIEARKLVQRSRELASNEVGPLSSALTLLGSVLMEKGSLDEAEKNLLEGEQIYRKLYSPGAITIYDNLRLQAQVSYLAGRYAEANTKINQVLENYRQNSNPKYISFATALTVQGSILNKFGRSVEAEKILREAVKLREANLPEKHFMTALTRAALGECLVALKRYDEAEALLLASYNSLRESQGSQNPRTQSVQHQLKALYRETNRGELAAKYE